MLKEIPLLVGNATTVAGATIATISANDFSGWSLAVIGVAITLLSGFHRHRREKYSSMRERIALCKECLNSKCTPNSCVVPIGYRDENCPLKNEKS